MSETPTTVVKPKYATATWYYQNDPIYREKAQQWSRESQRRRKEENPEAVREANRTIMKNKYQNDPVYREVQKGRAKARYHAKKAENAVLSSTQATTNTENNNDIYANDL